MRMKLMLLARTHYADRLGPASVAGVSPPDSLVEALKP